MPLALKTKSTMRNIIIIIYAEQLETAANTN